MSRVWADPTEIATFYVYPDGVTAHHGSPYRAPEGWRYAVTMHDHTGVAYDRETATERTVRPHEDWWRDNELIADAVIA
jgi:hypothetical protein